MAKQIPSSIVGLTLAGLMSLATACSPSATTDPNCKGDKCDNPDGVANAFCQREAARICQEALGEATAETIMGTLKTCAEEAFQACRDEVAFTAHCDVRRDDSLGCSSTSVAHSYVPGAVRWATQDVNCVSSGSDVNLISCREPALGSEDTGADERGRSRDELNDGRFDTVEGFAQAASSASVTDDRGQEYTEYFALVQMPGEAPRVIGRVEGDPDHNINFTEEQLEQIAFDHDGDGSFGSCVFTSWHTDNERPLENPGNFPAPPEALRAEWLSDTYDLAMNAENLRMRVSINGNGAAADLVDNCGTALAGLSGEEGSQLSPEARLSVNHEDPFERGCMRSYELFTTEWRRSDPTICTVPMRMEECGCGLKLDVGGEQLTLPVGTGVETQIFGMSRTMTALSRLLIPDQFTSQAGIFEQLADVARSMGKDTVAKELDALAVQGATDSRFFLRGFVLGGWDDINNNSALIGENLSGTPYQMSASQCTAVGGTPENGACRVATWGTPFSTEALAAPEGCRYVQIAKKGCAFAAEGEDCSNANGGLGEHGRNILACDISFNKMTQVMGSAGLNPEDGFKDMKSFCQAAYGDLAVVHIPYQASHIPSAELVCEPPPGMEEACGFAAANAATMVETNANGGSACTGGDEVVSRSRLPNAVLDLSNEETEESQRRDECSVVCVKGETCGDTCVADASSCTKEIGSACQGAPADLLGR